MVSAPPIPSPTTIIIIIIIITITTVTRLAGTSRAATPGSPSRTPYSSRSSLPPEKSRP